MIILPTQIKERGNKASEVKETPDPLTRRELLTQIASSFYYLIGRVTPVQQKAVIHVRETWDKPLSTSLREEAVNCLKRCAAKPNHLLQKLYTSHQLPLKVQP